VAKIERLGTPAVFIVAKFFAPDARFNARTEGLSAINLVQLSYPAVPLREEIEEKGLGKTVADEIVASFRERAADSAEVIPGEHSVPTFGGRDYAEAVEEVERFFLQHCWSDGYPIVPPTRAAVERMLTGTDLPPEHVVAHIEPKGAPATVEKIAINTVMAGCRPHYLPLVIAAVEALADPRFDLRGVQCTAGLTSPLLIASGKRLVEQLNINDSFSTLGPGWRANTTIGRAVRLIMINIGYAWPGKSDMKSFGSPFKNILLMAENEEAYQGHWPTLREAEGFHTEDLTVSAFAAMTWQLEYLPPEEATVAKMRELLGRQARVKYDKEAVSWGMDNLVLMNPTAFSTVLREGVTRQELQRMVYERAHLPADEFFMGREPRSEVGGVPIPPELVERAKADPKAPIPLLPAPENLKMIVAGAHGPAMMAYVSTWGWGLSHFVTRPVRLPGHWETLLQREQGWETPLVRRAEP
jgi:hypothetical protein